jgi:hypothetical protein
MNDLCDLVACRSAEAKYGARPCEEHCIYQELPMYVAEDDSELEPECACVRVDVDPGWEY